MKIFITLLFIFSQYSIASTTCGEMRKDLMALEYQLQKVKIKNCIDDKPECRTKMQLEKEYNSAMGSLIIAEGIAAIGMSIESQNNALTHLKDSELMKGAILIDDLEKSLIKANLLQLATNPKINPSFFSTFSGKTHSEINTYLHGVCFSSIQKKHQNDPFCKALKKQKNKGNSQYNSFTKTLLGFLAADNNIITANDRVERFQTYHDKLHIKIDDDPSYSTIEEFKGSKHYQNIQSLKKDLLALKRLKKNKADTRNISKKIILSISKLREVSLNYNPDIESTESPKITSFLQRKFEAPLKMMSALPALLLEDGIKDNFINASKRMDQHLRLSSASLDAEIAKKFRLRRNQKVNEKSINDVCKKSSNTTCLQTLCGDKSGSGSKICQHFGFHLLFNKLAQHKEHQKSQNKLTSAKKCLEKKVSPEEQKSCLEGIVKGEKNNIATLRSQLKEAKNNLASLIPYTRELNLRKGMALNGLNTNYCRSKFDKKSYDEISLRCHKSQSLIPSKEALSLGVDSRGIALEIEYDESLKKYLDATGAKVAIKILRNNFVKDCKSGQNKMKNFCSYYQSEINWENKLKRDELIRAENDKADSSLYSPDSLFQEPNYFLEGAKVFGVQLAKQTPRLVQTWINYDILKTQSNRQIKSIKRYDEFYIAQKERMESLKNNSSKYPFFSSNWGYEYTGFRGRDYRNFQTNAYSNNHLYRNSQSPAQFKFMPIPVTRTSFSGGLKT